MIDRLPHPSILPRKSTKSSQSAYVGPVAIGHKWAQKIQQAIKSRRETETRYSLPLGQVGAAIRPFSALGTSRFLCPKPPNWAQIGPYFGCGDRSLNWLF